MAACDKGLLVGGECSHYCEACSVSGNISANNFTDVDLKTLIF